MNTEYINYVKNLPQFKQGTNDWLNQRKSRLTSSDAATALGINPYRTSTELLFDKCGYKSSKKQSTKCTDHGQKYEDLAIQNYCLMMGKKNHTFGMIGYEQIDHIRNITNRSHLNGEVYNFLGGSPDGIAENINETHDDDSLVMLEVKCPLYRKIKPQYVPVYYYPQIQLNMFILNLDKTDFIEFIPNGVGKKPEISITRIFRDPLWFNDNFPKLLSFWNDVLFWRNNDITEHPEFFKYNPHISNPPKYLFKDSLLINDNFKE